MNTEFIGTYSGLDGYNGNRAIIRLCCDGESFYFVFPFGLYHTTIQAGIEELIAREAYRI